MSKKEPGRPRKKAAATGKKPRSGQQPVSQPSGFRHRDNLLNDNLARTTIALPLLEEMNKRMKATSARARLQPHHIIIDVNLLYPGGRDKARERVRELFKQILPQGVTDQGINETKSRMSQQYLFASLDAGLIQELVRLDKNPVPDASGQTPAPHSIWCVWLDFPVRALLTRSVSTVKADAACRTFGTTGKGVVWAVMDSGIDENHPHFARHQNLALPEQLEHLDFTALDPKKGRPLVDEYGHGTHVAGIIAGALAKVDGKLELEAEVHIRNEQDQTESKKIPLEAISGVAPECKLMSIKVLDQNGEGLVSNLITALEAIQEMNGYGKVIRIHGVNMSLGYEFNPEWFACGQSPLCSEVNRLVRSGVVVVAAAGNTGYGLALNRDGQTTFPTGLGLTINDPGNADLAITVGSTHRELPHTYGISYFSSKGPTGDGRDKPDLVAPGEKIISCASSWQPTEAEPGDPAETPAVVAHAATAGEATAAAAAPAPAVVTARYREDSGTSMAAPHVSGVIAGFLSARREFIGQPERVKEIFLSSATDLKRNRYFQGHGLVDLLRAIQSV